MSIKKFVTHIEAGMEVHSALLSLTQRVGDNFIIKMLVRNIEKL